MNAVNPGLLYYLRSGARIHFLSRKRSLFRRYLFFIDALAVFAAFLLAYALRFNFDFSSFNLGLCILQSLPVLLIYLGFEAIFKAFAGLPKPTVFQNIVRVLMSATISLVVLWLIVFFSPEQGWPQKWIHIPVSILVIHYLFSMVLLVLIRLCCRTRT